MITLQDVEESLAEMENAPPTYDTARKLAVLYTLREFMEGSRSPKTAAVPEVVVDAPGDSEFMKLVNGRDSVAVWRIVDELMGTLAVVEPRIYDGVMRRIRGIE